MTHFRNPTHPRRGLMCFAVSHLWMKLDVGMKLQARTLILRSFSL